MRTFWLGVLACAVAAWWLSGCEAVDGDSPPDKGKERGRSARGPSPAQARKPTPTAHPQRPVRPIPPEHDDGNWPEVATLPPRPAGPGPTLAGPAGPGPTPAGPGPRPRPMPALPPGAKGPLDEDPARLWTDAAYLGRQIARAVEPGSPDPPQEYLQAWLRRHGGLAGRRIDWELSVERGVILPAAQAAERYRTVVPGLEKLEGAYRGLRQGMILDPTTDMRMRRDIQFLRAETRFWKPAASGGGGYVLASADGLKAAIGIPPRLYAQYSHLHDVRTRTQTIRIRGRITAAEPYAYAKGGLWVEIEPD